MTWLALTLMGQVLAQTSWVGGPGHLGPTTVWGDSFHTANNIAWGEFPTLIRLTGVIANLPEHDIDLSVGGWDNDPDVYDLDGDGDYDVITTDESDPGNRGPVAWYENDGSGNFTKHTVLSNMKSLDEVSIGDLDGDGDPDMVICGHQSADTDLFWLENDGSQNFTFHLIDDDVAGFGSSEAEGNALGDLDGDRTWT